MSSLVSQVPYMRRFGKVEEHCNIRPQEKHWYILGICNYFGYSGHSERSYRADSHIGNIYIKVTNM